MSIINYIFIPLVLFFILMGVFSIVVNLTDPLSEEEFGEIYGFNKFTYKIISVVSLVLYFMGLGFVWLIFKVANKFLPFSFFDQEQQVKLVKLISGKDDFHKGYEYVTNRLILIMALFALSVFVGIITA